jgi:hypothetical protein
MPLASPYRRCLTECVHRFPLPRHPLWGIDFFGFEKPTVAGEERFLCEQNTGKVRITSALRIRARTTIESMKKREGRDRTGVIMEIPYSGPSRGASEYPRALLRVARGEQRQRSSASESFLAFRTRNHTSAVRMHSVHTE